MINLFSSCKKQPENPKEIISTEKPDRRLLNNVHHQVGSRSTLDRRGQRVFGQDDSEVDAVYVKKMHDLSLRYVMDFEVTLINKKNNISTVIKARSVDISASGILVEIDKKDAKLQVGEIYEIRFYLESGSMPEGFESTVNTTAKVVRIDSNKVEYDSLVRVGLQFEKNLLEYFHKKRWRYYVYSASTFLFIAVLVILLMRIESIAYYRYNIFSHTYSLITASFLLSRYLFGALYRDVPINPDFTPGVSIIIPCFNEEEWIRKTILGCLNQYYPLNKLEVIIVDDGSSDNSRKVIKETVDELHTLAERYNTQERVQAILLKENVGKRKALIEGVKKAQHELVVFVDSDSFLEPTAIINLVQPFQDPKMGGVTGRTDVANRHTNYLTKMQTVRYYIAFRIMKAAEAYFDCVTCLSGPISCYRKELVEKYADAWINQKFLGQPATFGDDRSMTNFIIKTHRTSYQDKAICSTVVPSDLKVFMKQQMRWKRSWLRESIRAGLVMPKKEPFMALFYYMGLMVPILAPIVFAYNIIYVPVKYGIFPLTFLVGFLLMSLLMSFSYMLFQKSSAWIFGMVFCVFYELVLLWQMPIAFLTFWKSTWGTRETLEDIQDMKKRKFWRRKKTSN